MVALILGVVEMQVVSPWRAAGWVALMAVIAVARALLCVAYRRADPPPARAHLWGRAAIAGIGVTGIAWGVGTLILFPPNATSHQLFLALTYGGMAAGGVAVLAALRGAVEALTVPMLLPLAFRFLAVNNEISVAVAALMLLCLGAMVMAGRRNHETIAASLRLREENGVLVERLRRKERAMASTNLLLQTEVTQRRRRERELEEMVRTAEEASRIKSQFLANMSHEIRTPMNGVLGMAELLLKGDLSPLQRRRAEIVHQSGESLLALVNDVLDLSKIEAGHLTIEVLPLDLHGVVESALAPFIPETESRGVVLSCELPPPPCWITGDPSRLGQLLTNLVGNAVKFTDRGTITVRVREVAGDADLTLRFEVADTGIGIDPTLQERIFSPFEQADGSTTRRYGGTGLGLAICREMVALMDGEIGVESRPCVGSTFWFTLPTRRTAPPPSPALAPSPRNPTAPRCHGRILVAEDNPVNQQVAAAMLDALGHHVVVVADGREAVAAVDDGGFDLCLMDCQMPEMDGFEATAAIRDGETEGVHLPIVALTAHAVAGDRDRCLAAGMDDYLSKPFTERGLAAMVVRWLDPAGTDDPTTAMRPETTDEREGWSLIDRTALAPIRTLEANGRPGLLAKVVGLYLDDAPQRLAALREGIDQGNAETVRKAAHALKSGSANVGAATLARLCRELEELGRDGCLPRMADLNAEINATYHLVSQALATEVDSYSL